MVKQKNQLSGLLLNLRRVAIALLLLLAFVFERTIAAKSHLAGIGLLSFVLLAQLAPLVIGALYWRKATSKAALTGLLVGSLLWLYTLLLPSLLPQSAWITSGFLGLSWLQPYALFGVSFLDKISHGLLFSLLANSSCFIAISLVSHRSVGEKLQAELFINKQQKSLEQQLSHKDLYQLLQRFVNNEAADTFKQHFAKANKHHMANDEQYNYTRLQLASVLGSASTRMVMKAASKKQTMPLEDVVNIVDEANELFQFNRELLQAGVENIEQGISMVDADMRIVAWNQRYLALLDYPKELVTVGKPISELIQYNIERGLIADKVKSEEISTSIARRLAHMRQGNSHYFQRTMPNGIVLEIRGQAMPGGGFVSTFSDISAHINTEKALQKANENLEQRVERRTVELSNAKAEAEAANSSKTRFLAAASHDLMQPFNAMSLFTNMLNKKVQGTDLQELALNIQNSLTAAESLLSDLVEISRLDNSSPRLDVHAFSIDDLLSPLNEEFTLLAQQVGLKFSYVKSRCNVATDQRLLHRIIQNFLSNAINYCPQANRQGKVLLGVRRQQENITIEVWDNGPGIPADKQTEIFKEFARLNPQQTATGLGLGLAICERIATLLGVSISVKSRLGHGTCFSLSLPRSVAMLNNKKVAETIKISTSNEFTNLAVILIDNEPLMLSAMQTQLQEWGCQVLAVKDEASLHNAMSKQLFSPAIVISDYHLDDGENGVTLVQKNRKKYDWQVPVVICSADPSEPVREHTRSAKFYFMRKPIKALALKKLMRQLLAST